MKNLYYVRHGESTINANRIWGSRSEGPLTKTGKKQALTAGRKMKKEKFKVDIIICSPTQRARETAEIIAKEIGYKTKDIVFDDRFLERSVGSLEGTGFDDFFRDNEYKDLDKVKGAETIEQLQRRAKTAHAYLLELPHKNVLVVSHSAFGRALKRAIHGQSHEHEYNEHESLPHAELIQFI